MVMLNWVDIQSSFCTSTPSDSQASVSIAVRDSSEKHDKMEQSMRANTTENSNQSRTVESNS